MTDRSIVCSYSKQTLAALAADDRIVKGKAETQDRNKVTVWLPTEKGRDWLKSQTGEQGFALNPDDAKADVGHTQSGSNHQRACS